MNYQLPSLSFEYDALEPYIDAEMLEIHYTKHHGEYVNKFNNAIKGTEYENAPIEAILEKGSSLPSAIRNNGGGHYNHSLFWDILSPDGGGKPDGKLIAAIEQTFGSFDDFKTKFANISCKQFGSGWGWLVITNNNELKITSTPNQDNPLMDIAEIQGTPILGLDVWEHAHYFSSQNKCGDYVDMFWNIVDWVAVENHYKNAQKAPESKLLKFITAAFFNDKISF